MIGITLLLEKKPNLTDQLMKDLEDNCSGTQEADILCELKRKRRMQRRALQAPSNVI